MDSLIAEIFHSGVTILSVGIVLIIVGLAFLVVYILRKSENVYLPPFQKLTAPKITFLPQRRQWKDRQNIKQQNVAPFQKANSRRKGCRHK